MMADSFYMYLSNTNSNYLSKAFALNLVPFHSPILTNDEWEVAALHGKISKTWNTVQNVSCQIERLVEDDEWITIDLKINNQRLEKVSEITAKLRDELKEMGQDSEQWAKFGGTGAASRKIVVQRGVKITFSSSLQKLLGLSHQHYDNSAGKVVLSINVPLDYLNIRDYNILYLMCKDTQGVYANNKVMGILTDITSDSNLVGVGDSIEFVNKNVVYHRWIGGPKTNIEVYFANSLGEVLQMNDGYSFVLLHFRKVVQAVQNF